MTPRELRFWSKVDKSGECWLWTDRLNSGGYGSFNVGGKTAMAHRFAYEAARSTIPPGLVIDHLCRVRHCVNPAHLEPVTMSENVRRGLCPSRVSAMHAAITHCPRGHEYSAENTYVRQNKNRQCRECRRADSRARYRASRAAGASL